MREVRDWFSLFAAALQLTLAVTAILAGRKSALGRPLSALCFALFGWNFANLGRHVFGGDTFIALDAGFTAISPPLVFELVLAFVGQSRRRFAVRVAAWCWFGAMALFALAGLASHDLLAVTDQPPFPIAFALGWLPTVVFEVTLLVRHLRRATDLREKSRTRTVLAALAIGSVFSMSDVARSMGLPFPYLGALGTVFSAGLLMTLVLRLELFDRNVSARTALYVLGMIVASVVAYLVTFRVFAGSLAAQAFVTAVVTLVVVAVGRELALSVSEARERQQRLVVVGRFSAQMAHDLRGPLAALIGATQVLEDLDDVSADGRKNTPATRKEFLGLVTEQAKRIAAIVDRYDRMGRVEPRKTVVRVDEVVRAVARQHDLSEDALKLAGDDLECDADRDLLESAVENVVRNAKEAIGEEGRVTVETELSEGAVVIRVVDTGEGMDARQLERAFEDFFTTKPTGSGLGLPFVRRILLAHGGDVAIRSERGQGTRVELRLPK